MSDHIKIRPAGGTWVVRAGGAVIGETNAALELIEGDMNPVIYFPRDDVAMAFVEESDTISHCPYKGDAKYYSIIAKSGPIEDAIWSFETPNENVQKIANYLAFYPSKVAVEQL